MSDIWPDNLVEELAYRRCLIFLAINEQIQNIAQKKDTLCRRMYN